MNQARQSFEKPRLLSLLIRMLNVIDRVESLSQVDEYGGTVMSLIDGGYDIV